MTDRQDNLFDFEVGGKIRVISYMKTAVLKQGVQEDIYSFVNDAAHELAICRIAAGFHTPLKRLTAGQTAVEGFIKGEGTLSVTSANGAKDSYYFEREGLVKEVAIQSGQSLQWTAPHDSSGLVYYEVRKAPAQPTPKAPPAAPKGEGRTAKLLLSSVVLSDAQAAELVKLVGKPAKDITFALIENAADVEIGAKAWVADNRKRLQSHGFNVEIIDLNTYFKDHLSLAQKLRGKDVVWVGGGHTFYLRWLLKATKADEIIKKLVAKGVVYGGGSAGAIIAGPTLKYFEAADDPNKAPEIVPDGLRLTESVVVPHMDNPKFKALVTDINKNLLSAHYKTVPLKDNQALVIDGDNQRIV